MARKRTGPTLAEDVYDQLRTEIFAGRRRPGSRLQLKEIADAQDVSLGVVREAATRLASEGLAESTPQIGFRVRPLSLDDLLDLTWTRIHLESIAVRASIAAGDVAWEAEVVAAHHRLTHTPPLLPERVDGRPGGAVGGRSVAPDWMAAHSAFHAALVSACTSGHLLRLRRQLFEASELYRHWSASLSTGDFEARMAAIEEEHRALLDAALARDADRAAELIAVHVQHTADALVRAAAATDPHVDDAPSDVA